MKIIHTAEELNPNDRKVVCLAIGVFDGVHLGHQHIIRQTVAEAAQHHGFALVVTFDRHPNVIVAPARVPPLIYSLPQKLRAIESLGAGSLLLLKFDEAFSRQSGEQFVRQLARDLGRIQSLNVGTDFTFGHKRSGNVALLNRLGAELRFAVHGLPAVSLEDKPISSTRIREAIRKGDLGFASRMLGRKYSLMAMVVAGGRLGRKLGFPTANLDATGLALPPAGVYAAHARLRGQTLLAVVNLGSRPTLQLAHSPMRVEAHLLGWTEDIYGEELEIVFGEKLRDEMKFPSVDDLKKQIGRDVERVRGRH